MIQVFSEYLQLAQAGKVNFLACPMHPEDGDLYHLSHYLDARERIVLTCYACGYKNIVGKTLYDIIYKLVAENSEPQKVEEEIK
jgi:hypothetical protein